MTTTIRRARWPVAVSLAVAIVAFPIFCVPTLAILFVIGLIPLDSGAPGYGLNDPVHGWWLTLGFCVFIPLAYYPSRFVYSCLRWKLVDADGKRCVDCGYNLTGNVSGVCPECGTQIEGNGRAAQAENKSEPLH